MTTRPAGRFTPAASVEVTEMAGRRIRKVRVCVPEPETPMEGHTPGLRGGEPDA